MFSKHLRQRETPLHLARHLTNAGALNGETQAEDLPTDCQRAVQCLEIFPKQAGLPWPSGIDYVLQNKHWEAAMNFAKEFLGAFPRTRLLLAQ
jgi:hypothetical protein